MPLTSSAARRRLGAVALPVVLLLTLGACQLSAEEDPLDAALRRVLRAMKV